MSPSAFWIIVSEAADLTLRLFHHITSFPSLHLSLSKIILFIHSITCLISDSSQENVKTLEGRVLFAHHSVITAPLPGTEMAKRRCSVNLSEVNE